MLSKEHFDQSCTFLKVNAILVFLGESILVLRLRSSGGRADLFEVIETISGLFAPGVDDRFLARRCCLQSQNEAMLVIINLFSTVQLDINIA